MPGSPAIDPAGTSAGAPTVDQRGYTRDATPDIGAYEFGGSNSPPTADASAGEPYTIAEGDSLWLDGSASSDPGGTIVSYEWDILNDGSFEATGMGVNFSWAGLNAAGITDDGSHDIALRVTDDGGAQATQVFQVSVNNTGPTLTATGAATVNAGSVYTLNLTASDPGDDLITTYTINWGDGTVTTETYAGPSTEATHTYTEAGFTRNITFTAEDEDGTWSSSDLIVGNWIVSDQVFRFDGATGDPDGLFGSSGGVLLGPYAPVVGPDGNYYVSGYFSDNIVRYDSDGNYLGVFASAGLDTPCDLAWGADGNLYVANNRDDNILRFAADGTFIDIFGTAGADLRGPNGLAFGPDGDLYVSSYENNMLVKFDGATGGTPTVVIGAGLSSPEQIVFGSGGDLFIADGGNDRVARWDGSSLTTYFTNATLLSYPTGLTFGPDGQLYVASYDNNRILRYDGATGEVFADDGPGGLTQPEYLKFSPAHQVHITVAAVNTAPVLDNTKSPALGGAERRLGRPLGSGGNAGLELGGLRLARGPGGQRHRSGRRSAARHRRHRRRHDQRHLVVLDQRRYELECAGSGGRATTPGCLAADANTRLYFQPNANYNGTPGQRDHLPGLGPDQRE